MWSFKYLQNPPYPRYQWVISEPKCTLTNCRCNCSQLTCGYTRDSLPFPYSGAFPNKGRNSKHFFPSANYSKKPQPNVLSVTTEGRTECFPQRLKGFASNLSLWLGHVFFWMSRQAQQPSRPKNLSTLVLKELSCLSKSQPLFSLLNFQAHPDTKHGLLPPKPTSLTAETQQHGMKAMPSSTSLLFSCTNSFDCTRHKTMRMVWRMGLLHLPQFPLH